MLTTAYTESEVEKLLAARMQSIADNTAEMVSHDEVKTRIKALIARVERYN